MFCLLTPANRPRNVSRKKCESKWVWCVLVSEANCKIKTAYVRKPSVYSLEKIGNWTCIVPLAIKLISNEFSCFCVYFIPRMILTISEENPKWEWNAVVNDSLTCLHSSMSRATLQTMNRLPFSLSRRFFKGIWPRKRVCTIFSWINTIEKRASNKNKTTKFSWTRKMC